MKKKTQVEIFDLEDLLNSIKNNVKENTTDFNDLVNLDGASNREIYLGDITDGTGLTINGYITFWNRYDDYHNIPTEDRKPIKIIIDSIGGNLTDTFTMIDAIKLSITPVWTIAIGSCYSGGFFTFIAGHKRIAYPHASFLYHEGSTSTGGTSSQFENYSAYYKKQLNQLKQVVLENTKITEEEYDEIHKDDIWYLVDEAIEKGIVDEVALDLA